MDGLYKNMNGLCPPVTHTVNTYSCTCVCHATHSQAVFVFLSMSINVPSEPYSVSMYISITPTLRPKGYRTLEDLEQSGVLNRQQLIGIRYYDEFNERMPREEVAEIEAKVRNCVCHRPFD